MDGCIFWFYHFCARFSMKSRMAYSPIAITHRITMDISTHVSLKVWKVVDDQISKPLPCTNEFTDDHADQAQSNIDFHHTQDERHGRRKDNLCQFVFFCAAEGADEFQFFRVSFAEAGVEIDD